jgi:hypothetical protein
MQKINYNAGEVANSSLLPDAFLDQPASVVENEPP